jgi:hypothetical protein
VRKCDHAWVGEYMRWRGMARGGNPPPGPSDLQSFTVRVRISIVQAGTAAASGLGLRPPVSVPLGLGDALAAAFSVDGAALRRPVDLSLLRVESAC